MVISPVSKIVEWEQRNLPRNRIFLGIFWGICVFANFPLGESEGSLTIAHLAELALFGIALFSWLGLPNVRRWKGTRSQLFCVILIALYLGLRIALSGEGELFLRHAAKLGLLILGVCTYRMLDPRNKLITFSAWYLPALFAIAILWRLLFLLLTGQFTETRLEMPPYSHEYVGIIASYLLGILVFYWYKPRTWTQNMILALVGGSLLLGLFLSAVRGGLLAVLIIIMGHLFLSGRSLGKKLKIAAGFALLFSVLGSAYTFDTRLGESRLQLSNDTTLTGRTIVWAETYVAMTSNWERMLFGMGLGSVQIYAEEAGGWKYDVFNGFLTAWANFGLLGLAAYGYILWLFYRRIRSLDKRSQVLLLPLFFAFLVSDMFDTRWQQTHMGWLLAFIFYLFSSNLDSMLGPHAATADPAGSNA